MHRDTFGRDELFEVPKIDLEELDDGWYGYAYEVEVGNDKGGASASGQAGDTVHRRMTTGMHLPFTVRSTIHYETGLDHIILLCSTPIDDVTSYFTFVVWRNDDFSVPAEEIIAFDRAIGAEDKRDARAGPGRAPARPAANGERPGRPAVGRVATSPGGHARRGHRRSLTPADRDRPGRWFRPDPSGA